MSKLVVYQINMEAQRVLFLSVKTCISREVGRYLLKLSLLCREGNGLRCAEYEMYPVTRTSLYYYTVWGLVTTWHWRSAQEWANPPLPFLLAYKWRVVIVKKKKKGNLQVCNFKCGAKDIPPDPCPRFQGCGLQVYPGYNALWVISN